MGLGGTRGLSRVALALKTMATLFSLWRRYTYVEKFYWDEQVDIRMTSYLSFKVTLH